MVTASLTLLIWIVMEMASSISWVRQQSYWILMMMDEWILRWIPIAMVSMIRLMLSQIQLVAISILMVMVFPFL